MNVILLLGLLNDINIILLNVLLLNVKLSNIMVMNVLLLNVIPMSVVLLNVGAPSSGIGLKADKLYMGLNHLHNWWPNLRGPEPVLSIYPH